MPASRFALTLLAGTAAIAPVGTHAQTAPAPVAKPQQEPQPAPAKPEEVTVTGGRDAVTVSTDRMSFDVGKDLQTQTGTVADALRNVPGVEVDLEGRVSLRGDQGVTILIDGRPSAMMRGESRGNVLLTMPAGQIERVEVITNPSAAFSPEGSAGVINLVTRRTRSNTRSVTVRANVGSEGRGGVSASVANSSGPLTLTGELNYRRFTTESGLVQDRVRIDGGGNALTSRQESLQDNTISARSARFGVDYDVDKKNRLSAEFNWRNNRVESDRDDSVVGAAAGGGYDRESDMGMRMRAIGGRTSWRKTIATGHEISADVELEQFRMRREIEAVTTPSGGASEYERIRNAGDRSDLNIKLDYKRPMGEGRSLNIGYQGEISDTDFDFAGARGGSFDTLAPVAGLTNRFDLRQSVHALFATFQIDTGKLELQPGLRLEQVDLNLNQITDGVRAQNDYFRAYPTLHLGYELSASQKLRASYSRRVQRPSGQDLNPYTLYIDPLNLRRGNPDLLPEITDSFELGWHLRKGGAFYSVTAFYRTSRGGVTDVVADLGGVFLTTRANLATGERAGVEAIANGKLSKTLSYNASATFMWNEIDARVGGVAAPRSGTTGTLRANLTWQPTQKDYVQVSGFLSGDQLLAQGYRRSGGVLNLGYRRKLNDRFSLMLTAQNVLDSAKQVTFIETPTLRDRFEQRGAGRILLFGVTYTLGQSNRRRNDPGFDFDQGGVPQ